MREGLQVQCPFRGCDSKFTVVSSFASHISRKHKNESVVHVDHSNMERCIATEYFSQCAPYDHSDDEPEETVAVDESLFQQNITLFYLKLQAKLLLPATTIQTIIEGYQYVHDISLTNLFNNLSDKLTVLGVPEATVNNIMMELREEDLLTACNSEPLSTDQKRKTAFNKYLNYVDSVPLF